MVPGTATGSAAGGLHPGLSDPVGDADDDVAGRGGEGEDGGEDEPCDGADDVEPRSVAGAGDEDEDVLKGRRLSISAVSASDIINFLSLRR